MQNGLPETQQEKQLSAKERKAIEKQKPPLFPNVQGVLIRFPMFLVIPIIYIVLGMFFKLWHPTWLMFLVIPFYYQLCHAFGAKNEKSFLLRLPVVPAVLILFLCSGIFLGLWKYTWIMFLAIPLYYWVVAFMKIPNR